MQNENVVLRRRGLIIAVLSIILFGVSTFTPIMDNVLIGICDDTADIETCEWVNQPLNEAISDVVIEGIELLDELEATEEPTARPTETLEPIPPAAEPTELD